jgi:hypothetical protein
VAVTARDRHAWLREPELGPDDVDNTLVCAADVVERNAVLGAVALERRHHCLGHRVEERPLTPRRRHDVIDRRERAVRERDAPAALAEHVERLRAGDLVHEVKADEQLRLTGRQAPDRMRVPYLRQQCLAHNHSLSPALDYSGRLTWLRDGVMDSSDLSEPV